MPDSIGNKKARGRMMRLGLIVMGIVCHGFLSTPILLNSSELMLETNISTPAKARSRSKQTTLAIMNIGHSLLIYLVKRRRSQEDTPLNELVMYPSSQFAILHWAESRATMGLMRKRAFKRTWDSGRPDFLGQKRLRTINLVEQVYFRTVEF